MAKELIFITGFFGARLENQAQEIAQQKGYDYLSLDEEIEKADGRSVRRICMMMGEHEYRNKEYEMLQHVIENAVKDAATDDDECSSREAVSTKGAVICCSDGVLLDDMSRKLLQKHTLLILGGDLSLEDLWHNANEETDTCHAFMHFGTQEERRAAFDDLHQRQQTLFAPYLPQPARNPKAKGL